MPPRLLHPDEYELVSRSSFDSRDSFDLDEADPESRALASPSYPKQSLSLLQRLWASLSPAIRPPRRFLLRNRSSRPAWKGSTRPSCSYRPSACRRLFFVAYILSGIVAVLVLLTAIISPSYTHRPAHYDALRQAIRDSNEPGRGNPRNEKVFIAASIYDRDGSLARGQWGRNVLDLIELLGPDNTYLSVFENDSGDVSAAALQDLEQKVPCNRSMVYEPHLDLKNIPRVTLPGGSERLKRIAFLSEVRNRALQPLDDPDRERFDKLLYINDVFFDPIDAVQLLFATNVDKDGKSQYRAAFMTHLPPEISKDTRPAFPSILGSQTLEKARVGATFYTSAMLSESEAVGVASASLETSHGDRRHHQSLTPRAFHPARFRAEPDPYWDASECCLINADIQIPPHKSKEPIDTGIYMNPYIRVAYDTSTLSWLGLTRRFERLYSLPHNILNHLVGMPWYNPRREERAGQRVEQTVWSPEKGSYETVTRVAGTGGFCGRRALQVMIPNPKKGHKNWEMLPVPPE
ncbi:hypothetical protein CIHG_03117 [Coccidioides immitis H538.4]|uniref:Uncharacterized protein n=1 Tax=Coccidioides immitis H538.4 TaxID=396776 RepID=A0A0J8UDH7_COCIT|nr:hypothetical protein CIHG_03117 [Coccidioides immitis H538.4]